MTKNSSIILNDAANIFDHEKPDLVLLMADRYEVLPVAIAASYQNIPLAHIQGGEVTGNIDEKVRHSISKLADLHFVSNSKCKKNVIQMGEDINSVFDVGCPSMDVCRIAKNKLIPTKEISSKILGSFNHKQDFIIVMFHPETESLQEIQSQIDYLLKEVKKLNIQTLWFWPNSDPGFEIISAEIRKARENDDISKISFVKSLQPEIFLSLLNKSLAIIGNSSAGIRESNFFGTPSVNIGIRQLGREAGNNVLQWKFNSKISLSSAIKKVLHKRFAPGKLYGDGFAGERIAKLIQELPLNYSKKFISLEDNFKVEK